MPLNLADRATAATRVRLVYRITVGIAGDIDDARNRAQEITEAWQSSDDSAFVVSAATDPVRGGAAGAGVLGILGGVWGVRDYFTALDIKTNSGLRTMTWGELIAPHRRFGFLGAFGDADLDHIDLVPVGTPAGRTLARPSAQEAAAQVPAQQSRAQSSPAQLLGAVGGLVPWILLALAAVAGVYVYQRSRA